MALFRSTLSRSVSSAICRSESFLVKFYCKKVSELSDGPFDPEVEFFSDLAHSWWDMKTVLPLHRLNEVRVPFIRDEIRQLLQQNSANPGLNAEFQGLNILDVGYGGGILSEPLARLKANVVGVDPSPNLVSIARQHAGSDPHLKFNLTYENESIVYSYSQKNRSKFDAVVVSEVIEHIANSNKEEFVRDCLECLKPGGSIFITTPNKTLVAKLLYIWMVEKLGIIPTGTHDYEMFIAVEDLSKLLEKYVCSIKRVEGISFNLLTKKFSFSDSKHLMYAIHAQKTG